MKILVVACALILLGLGACAPQTHVGFDVMYEDGRVTECSSYGDLKVC